MKLCWRTLLAGLSIAALSACSSGGSNNPFGPNGGICDPGTQVQLDNPNPYQSNVSTNTNQINIVANGNNNFLYTSYNQWNIILQGNLGDQIIGGNLNLIADPNGLHPYTSDYYYGSSVQNLRFGETYIVRLNYNANCTPLSIGQFST